MNLLQQKEALDLAKWVNERTGTVEMEYKDYRDAVRKLCETTQSLVAKIDGLEEALTEIHRQDPD